VPPPSRLLARLALGALPLLALGAAPAAAPAAGLPCGDQGQGRTRCTRVLVPLDRTGAVEGRIGLSVRTIQFGQRRRKVRKEALVFLAGGPGQAATTLAGDVAPLVKPFLRTRYLVAVDTRGTGRSSDLIVCPELETSAVTGLSTPEAFRSCAARIGPAVDRYGTTDVVEDLEAVRIAGGYDKLYLFGVSYGTYTAQRYAAAHPDRTAGLVLDSTVDASGEDPFSLATFRALPSALRHACLRRACAGVTPDVDRDLDRVRARLPLTASVDDGEGRRRPGTVTAPVLIALIQTGDLDPFLRATLPGGLRRAAQGDPAPLARLARETGLLPLPTDDEDPSQGPAAAGAESTGSYVATICRDTHLPWAPGTPAGDARRAAAVAALAARPAAARAGWRPEDLADSTPAGVCADWPGTPDDAPVGPLPRVPTLLLSGEDDTRTSPEEARRVAARTPGAQLLSVPGAGHSLIGSGRDCVRRAFVAFAAGRPLGRCHRPSAVLKAVPLAPSSPAGLGRTPADRARGVARAAILDATRTYIVHLAGNATIDLFSEPEPVHVAGLRSGSATVTAKGELVLDRFGYVPNTAVSSGRIGEQRRIRVAVRGAGLRAGSYEIQNPLADPDVLDELGIDPSLLPSFDELAARVPALRAAR
jgi:pimeloyl-ACP methyl ester carboxylesterase